MLCAVFAEFVKRGAAAIMALYKYEHTFSCIHIRHIGIHNFPKRCTRYVAYPNCMHIKISVNQAVYVFYNKATSQIEKQC
jgi:hypothetical protein